jgi:two-component system, NarL family, sensor histidine kinase UhpB
MAFVMPQPAGLLVLVLTLPLAILSLLASTAILLWGAVRRSDVGAGLLAVPLLVTAWYGIRDIAVVVGWYEGAFLLFSYIRPLTIGAIMMLLMYRLAISLNKLDAAHETLLLRLDEQQRELSRLHEKEQRRTADAVREEERLRLTRDLHDGLSGNLVSIIALAEEPEPERAAIEQAAREALDDLRLVINSLDIGDRDLPLALASFRERLAPRLRRLGVELDWSMEQLPEVSGVTPSGALAVLRILQEGVTNALKHGPARRIAIQGNCGGRRGRNHQPRERRRSAGGAGKGHGLDNMRRRAEALGGRLALEPRGWRRHAARPRPPLSLPAAV